MQILKLTCTVDLNMLRISNLNVQNVFVYLTLNQINYSNVPKFSVLRRTFLYMDSQPHNPEFRNNPENFHPCISAPV